MVDSFSGWTEMILLPNKNSETVAKNFYLHWIARYGIPRTVKSDRGTEFTGVAFSQMLLNLGCKPEYTLAYSPFQNGLAEARHRSLKVALRAGDPNDWITSLSAWLLATRADHRSEYGCSPCEIVYGEPIALPGDMFDYKKIDHISRESYLDRIQESLAKIIPNHRKMHIPGVLDKRLEKCDKIFIRDEARKGLSPIYKGPYKVLERHQKHFVVKIRNRAEKISLNRIKAACVLEDAETQSDESLLNQETKVQEQKDLTQNEYSPGQKEVKLPSSININTEFKKTKKEIPAAVKAYWLRSHINVNNNQVLRNRVQFAENSENEASDDNNDRAVPVEERTPVINNLSQPIRREFNNEGRGVNFGNNSWTRTYRPMAPTQATSPRLELIQNNLRRNGKVIPPISNIPRMSLIEKPQVKRSITNTTKPKTRSNSAPEVRTTSFESLIEKMPRNNTMSRGEARHNTNVVNRQKNLLKEFFSPKRGRNKKTKRL